MQVSAHGGDAKSVMLDASEAVSGIGSASDPEVLELLGSMSSEAADAIESISETIPVLMLLIVSRAAVKESTRIRANNHAIGASSPRAVAAVVGSVADEDVDAASLMAISRIVSTLGHLVGFLQCVRSGETVFERDAALFCGDMSVSVMGLTRLSEWLSLRLLDLSGQE